jgi:hypothetical protein
MQMPFDPLPHKELQQHDSQPEKYWNHKRLVGLLVFYHQISVEDHTFWQSKARSLGAISKPTGK